LLGLAAIGCDGTTDPDDAERFAELSAVAAGPGRIVAVGGWWWGTEGVLPGSDSLLIASSGDGVTWETATPTARGHLNDVTYGGGRFVAVGQLHEIHEGPSVSAPRLYTSADGREWQAVANPPDLRFRSVTFGAGRFVAVGIDPATLLTAIATSPDGSVWTETAVADYYSAMVTFGNGAFVLWGEHGSVGVSADGVNWEVVAVDSVNAISEIAYVNGVFLGSGRYDCCFGEIPGQVLHYDLTSPDGRAWTVRRRAEPAQLFAGFAFGSGRLVAHGAYELFVSSDGVAWRRTREADDFFSDVIYANGAFIVVGRQVLRSIDGEAWTATSYQP
jgi:hypothetical protein